MFQLTFIFDGLLALIVLMLAFGHLRVWWSYIIAGELTAMLGLSMIFHYFYMTTDGIGASSWYYLYGIAQCLVLGCLYFSFAKHRFLWLYLVSAGLSLAAGVSITANGSDLFTTIYPWSIAIVDLSKVGFMAAYWYSFVRGRDYSSFNRIHVWQS